MSAGAFAKIAGATPTGGGNIIRDGNYKLMVEKVFIHTNHNAQESFIAEFRVLESSPNGELDPSGNPVKPNAVGSSCSMVCKLAEHESAAGNAKAFVIAALAGLGIAEEKITPDVMGWVCSEQNPLRGLVITDETRRTTNKGRKNPANAGKPLTLNNWKPVSQALEEVEKGKAWLGQNAATVDTGAAAPAQTATAAIAQATQQVAAAPKPAVPSGLAALLGPK